MEPQTRLCLLSCDEAAEKACDIRIGWVDELQFGTNRESEISVLTLMDPQGGVKINRRAKSLSWVQFAHTHPRCTEKFCFKLNSNIKTSSLKIKISGREIQIKNK